MDISKYNFEGEWVTIETENADFGKLEVLVVPVGVDKTREIMDGNIFAIIDAVVIDWNLTSNGTKIECNTANKKKYLSKIAMWSAKNPQHSKAAGEKKSVGSEIIGFSQNDANFTKN